jgi:multiple antibiotic resistance protein
MIIASPLVCVPRLAPVTEIDLFRIAAQPELRGMLHEIPGILTDGRMEGMDTTTWLGFAGLCLAGYFAIMNPIANTPIFISLTSSNDRSIQKSIARRSTLLAFFIIAVCSLVGNLIFKLFGITLPTLQVAGGIIVFTIGYKMLQGSGADSHTPSDKDIDSSREAKLSVAVSPLGIPLLAGPGTIATAMSFAADGWLHIAVSVASFGLICIVTYLCFNSAERLVRFLGQNGLNVMTRLMGLIVAAIGVNMFLTGLKTFGW